MLACKGIFMKYYNVTVCAIRAHEDADTHLKIVSTIFYYSYYNTNKNACLQGHFYEVLQCNGVRY